MRSQLAQFPISVVTARPASGEYVMIVFGGRASQVGSQFSGAVNQLDCEYDLDAPCKLGSPIARDPRAFTQCIGVAPHQDEVAAIRGTFCR